MPCQAAALCVCVLRYDNMYSCAIGTAVAWPLGCVLIQRPQVKDYFITGRSIPKHVTLTTMHLLAIVLVACLRNGNAAVYTHVEHVDHIMMISPSCRSFLDIFCADDVELYCVYDAMQQYRF